LQEQSCIDGRSRGAACVTVGSAATGAGSLEQGMLVVDALPLLGRPWRGGLPLWGVSSGLHLLLRRRQASGCAGE
jgi:hypothetical protein